MLIEQAIFTSTQTERTDGYQLVGCSPGLSSNDALELNIWGPSHDSLLDRPGERSSTNFFKLTSGAYCVSRTVLAGAEYSGRGEVISTHFLVVPPELMARFANNPFAVLRAATASGAMQRYDRVPKALESLRLGGRSGAVDVALLAQLARDPGPAVLSALTQAALASDRLAIFSKTPIERLVAGLFSLLPIECRGDFSFSTGLMFSPSRPLRLAALSSDRASWRAMDRNGFTLANLDDAAESVRDTWQGWAGCVAQVLTSGRLSILSTELEQRRPWLCSAKLDELAQQVQARLQGSTTVVSAPAAVAPPPVVEPTTPAPTPRATEQRADGAHIRRGRVLAAVKDYVAKSTVEELVEVLASQPAEILELLERIDDLIFSAIDGSERALAELQVLWPTVAAELNEDLIEQSREQYLRCALSIWTECVEGQVRRPERAVAAIDVLCVLFEE